MFDNIRSPNRFQRSGSTCFSRSPHRFATSFWCFAISLNTLRRATVANCSKCSLDSVSFSSVVFDGSPFIGLIVGHTLKSPKHQDFGPINLLFENYLKLADDDRPRKEIVCGAPFFVKEDGQKSGSAEQQRQDKHRRIDGRLTECWVFVLNRIDELEREKPYSHRLAIKTETNGHVQEHYNRAHPA